MFKILGTLWYPCYLFYYTCVVVRKPVFAYAKTKALISCAVCEIKGADQLHSNPAADQRLCFHYIKSTLPLYFPNPKFQAPSHLLWLTAWFMSGLFGNTEDRFSCCKAYIPVILTANLAMTFAPAPSPRPTTFFTLKKKLFFY